MVASEHLYIAQTMLHQTMLLHQHSTNSTQTLGSLIRDHTDHIFKVVANIGAERSDSICVTLYNSLFIVMNEYKQIVSFKFVRKEKNYMVGDVLEKIHVTQGEDPPSYFVIDNCFKWREKLKSIFHDVIVKLDPFHAIKRITETVRKDHPQHTAFCKDLRNVLRRSECQGVVRKKATVSIDVLKAR